MKHYPLTWYGCLCRKPHPCISCRMLVLTSPAARERGRATLAQIGTLSATGENWI